MKFKCFELIQNGMQMYSTVMPAEVICNTEKVKVDIFSSINNPDGYQRDPAIRRAREFKVYIEKAKGISPPSILLSVRNGSDAKYTLLESISENISYGELELPDDAMLWLVDGQHRRAGLLELIDLNPEYSSFPISVLLLVPGLWNDSVDEIYEEAKQFVIINRTQKGVRSDLAERFLTRILKQEPDKISEMPSKVISGIEWVPKAIQIAEILNNKSPIWKGRVQMPNDRGTAQTIVTQRSLTQSLRPVLHSMIKEDPTKDIAMLLDRYWQAIREICPEAFEEPKLYVIQKTTGVTVLHDLFVKVLTGLDPSETVTVEAFKNLLSRMPSMSSEFWGKDGRAGLMGTSGKAFSLLATMLKAEFDETNATAQRQVSFRL